MADLFQPDPWRDTLITIVEIGGIVVVMGAAAIYSLRKAFRFTDAFEKEPEKPGNVRSDVGTVFPVETKHSAPMGEPKIGERGPVVREKKIP
jgi:hypothetical protein